MDAAHNNEIAEIMREFGITSVQYSRDVIDVSSYADKPDPRWEYTDGQGHNHRMSKKQENRYPTLLWIVDYLAGEDDEYGSSGHYECAACGEIIWPGMLPPTYMKEVVGGPILGTISFSDGKTVHCDVNDLEKIDAFVRTKYDYGHTKLREFISVLKSRSK